mmetsp:Transcript_13284/g.40791  ORF Transcript_13284/g.40791 Transcript_13284/m.40791 type:complete len:293 (-) Transcript_13284:1120-1998(-)
MNGWFALLLQLRIEQPYIVSPNDKKCLLIWKLADGTSYADVCFQNASEPVPKLGLADVFYLLESTTHANLAHLLLGVVAEIHPDARFHFQFGSEFLVHLKPQILPRLINHSTDQRHASISLQRHCPKHSPLHHRIGSVMLQALLCDGPVPDIHARKAFDRVDDHPHNFHFGEPVVTLFTSGLLIFKKVLGEEVYNPVDVVVGRQVSKGDANCTHGPPVDNILLVTTDMACLEMRSNVIDRELQEAMTHARVAHAPGAETDAFERGVFFHGLVTDWCSLRVSHKHGKHRASPR